MQTLTSRDLSDGRDPLALIFDRAERSAFLESVFDGPGISKSNVLDRDSNGGVTDCLGPNGAPGKQEASPR